MHSLRPVPIAATLHSDSHHLLNTCDSCGAPPTGTTSVQCVRFARGTRNHALQHEGMRSAEHVPLAKGRTQLQLEPEEIHQAVAQGNDDNP
jgi:hypothetical protein